MLASFQTRAHVRNWNILFITPSNPPFLTPSLPSLASPQAGLTDQQKQDLQAKQRLGETAGSAGAKGPSSPSLGEEESPEEESGASSDEDESSDDDREDQGKVTSVGGEEVSVGIGGLWGLNWFPFSY